MIRADDVQQYVYAVHAYLISANIEENILSEVIKRCLKCY